MLRETLGNWKQFLAIVGIGAIAVTLFVGLLSNSKSLSDRVESFYRDGNMADIYVTTSSYSWKDKENIVSVLDEGDEVEGRFEVTNKVNGTNYYCAVMPTLPKISRPTSIIDDKSDPLKTTTEDYFFLMDEALRDDNPDNIGKSGYALGDIAKISYNFSSYLNPTSIALLENFVDTSKPNAKNVLAEEEFTVEGRVTGFMKTPENVTKASYYASTYLMSKSMFREGILKVLSENYTEDGITVIRDVLAWGDDENIADPSNFPQTNQYLVKLKDPASLEKKENALKDLFDSKDEHLKNLMAITDRETNPWSAAMDTDVKGARQLTFVFPFVFFLVALLVILTTISQMILKERTQIGTMKALGLSKKEIYYHYISLTSTLVGVASLLGCVAGPLIIPFVMAQKYDILYSLPARALFVFPIWQAIATVLIFLLASALVTVLVIRKEISLTPAQSMRPALITFKGKSSLKSKLSSVGLSIKMAFRNIRVNVVKSLMVVIGVMGCTALLVCGYGIDDTLDHGVKNDLSTFYGSEIIMTYSSPDVSRKATVYSASSYIEHVEEFLITNTSLSVASSSSATKMTYNSSLRFFGEEMTHFKPQEKWEMGTICASKKVLEELKCKKGDTIEFTYSGNTYSGVIGAVYDTFSVNGLFIYFPDYPEIEERYNNAFIDVPSEKAGEVYEILKTKEYCGSLQSLEDMRTRISDIMSGISIMTAAVKVFAVLLAIVVLYNLSLLNFKERTRDIATLKVLGFSKTEIAMSLMFESLSLTLLGVVVGFFLGYPFMYLVLYVNKVALVNFMYTIYPLTFVLSFAVTFVVSFVVNLFLSTMTGKVKMVESLKSVE